MSNPMLVAQPAGLSWAAAACAVQAAVSQAEQLGILVHAAVVDSHGNTLTYLRMPGAFLHSEQFALDKAYTAASFGFPTGEWMDHIGDSPSLKVGLTQHPRLAVLGGGLPIRDAGVCIAGIGVSGGSEAQDQLCAEAAIAALDLS
tara:strand:+ start:1068 stop:1502 length:435 start_codon:yes stop_codon:yes gene_type:complete